METLKIVLVGDANVGKTSFVKKLLGEEVPVARTPTLGVEVDPIRQNGKHYNIWDCAGEERYSGLGDGYYVQAQGAIIMCDCMNSESITHIERYASSLRKFGNFPIVIVLNKCELLNDHDRNILSKALSDVIFISCANGMNVNEVLKKF